MTGPGPAAVSGVHTPRAPALAPSALAPRFSILSVTSEGGSEARWFRSGHGPVSSPVHSLTPPGNLFAEHHLCAGPVSRPRAEPAGVPTPHGVSSAETKSTAMATHRVDRHCVRDRRTQGELRLAGSWVPDKSRGVGWCAFSENRDGHPPHPGALPGPASVRPQAVCAGVLDKYQGKVPPALLHAPFRPCNV